MQNKVYEHSGPYWTLPSMNLSDLTVTFFDGLQRSCTRKSIPKQRKQFYFRRLKLSQTTIYIYMPCHHKFYFGMLSRCKSCQSYASGTKVTFARFFLRNFEVLQVLNNVSVTLTVSETTSE